MATAAWTLTAPTTHSDARVDWLDALRPAGTVRAVPSKLVHTLSKGYSATKHQHEVGTGYLDVISELVSSGSSSTTALKGSTEEEQFH